MRAIMNCSLLLLSLTLLLSRACSTDTQNQLIQCLSASSDSISSVIYTPTNSSFIAILKFLIQNPRFETPDMPLPLLLIEATRYTHVQAAIHCTKKHGVELRIRSGGHDYEGLSYRSRLPFVLLDLFNIRSIQIDSQTQTAWVQVGATIGELYYNIYKTSDTLAFPAGIYPTVGVGGHLSGGGYGMMLRKFGLAADHILDAKLIDSNGKILDRRAMGEELFWAIRGGGGGSFGVILEWKIQLVRIPPVVTVFTATRNLQQNGMKIVLKWQEIAHKFDGDLLIRLNLTRGTYGSSKTIVASFESLYLGPQNKLLSLLAKKFPELRLSDGECLEMRWVDSALYFAGFPLGTSPDALLNRTQLVERKFKAKSDYVKVPIPESGWKGIWDFLYEEDLGAAMLLMNPYGAKMAEIPASAIPFPHRKGNLYQIQHVVSWDEEGKSAYERHVEWIRRLYAYLKPYVSKSPRAAYYNYKDLDLGINEIGNASYNTAKVWGVKYFINNFDRLVSVKTMVDPGNFFRNELSIPSLAAKEYNWVAAS